MALIPLQQADPMRYKAWIESSQQPGATLNATNAQAGASGASAAHSMAETQIAQRQIAQQQFFDQAKQVFEKAANKNGKVDPNTYNEVQKNASALGIPSDQFDKNFENAYADPKNLQYNTANALTKRASSGAALNFIDTLEKHYSGAGAGQTDLGPLTRILSPIIGAQGNAGLNPSAKTYGNEKAGFAATLKSITGDVGVLTDKDYERLAGLLPGFGATPEEVQQSFNDIRGQIAAKYNINPTSTTIKPPTQGPGNNIMQNAGNDVKGIINGILGLPAVALQEGMKYPGNPNMAVAETAGNMAKGVVNEYNQALGQPLQGGDIVGRILQHAQQHPVNTALDVLPFLGAGKAALAAKAGEAGQAGEVAGQVGNIAKAGEAANPLQKGITSVSDLLNAGGSKKYITRQATGEGVLPQNQILNDEGIYLHPTETGRIKATAQAIDKYGGQLADTYAQSDRHFTGKTLGDTLQQGLQAKGWDQKAINQIKAFTSDQGGFDLGKGDTLITMESAWKAAQKLERNPPKSIGSAESAVSMKKLSTDAGRIIREELAQKVPETLPLNQRYSALRDFYDNKLPDNPTGASIQDARGGLPGAAAALGKDILNPILNAGYKAANKPDVMQFLRDRRTKIGNVQFKK